MPTEGAAGFGFAAALLVQKARRSIFAALRGPIALVLRLFHLPFFEVRAINSPVITGRSSVLLAQSIKIFVAARFFFVFRKKL